MKATVEIIKTLKTVLIESIDAASHINGYKLEYIDVNISVCPGEPALFEKKGCNAVELLQLIGDFEKSNCRQKAGK